MPSAQKKLVVVLLAPPPEEDAHGRGERQEQADDHVLLPAELGRELISGVELVAVLRHLETS